MGTNSRLPALLAILALQLGEALAQGAEPPSIQEFQRAYRAAYDRQAAATSSLKMVFHKEVATLPVPVKPGEQKQVVKKTKEQIEKEQDLERRIEATNRMLKMDMTYHRSGERQRLDIKALQPEGKGEWLRSIVQSNDGSFAAHKMPDAREYALEYLERGTEHAAGEFNQAVVFVNASRHVGNQEASELLLGAEFAITKLRVEVAPGPGGEPADRLIVDVRRIKPPKPSRVPRHQVRATLTLQPNRDYRLVHFVLESNDGYVNVGTIEYGEFSGPRALIPSKFVQEMRKDGIPHRRVETLTTKEVSFDKLPDDVFMPRAFGIDTSKPGESSMTPIILGGLGLALVGLGVFLYVRHSRNASAVHVAVI